MYINEIIISDNTDSQGSTSNKVWDERTKSIKPARKQRNMTCRRVDPTENESS